MRKCVSTQPRPKRHGFTLIEIILVVMIMGIVAGLGLPRIDFYKYRADANATMVRSLMMQAQRDAIVRQHDLIFSIDTVRNRIIIGYDQNNDGSIVMSERIRMQALPEQGKFATPGTPVTTEFTSFGPMRATAMRTISGYPSVIFRRDGSVSSGFELYMTTKRAKATDMRAVTVVQSTGRAAFFRFNGTTWKAAQ